MYIAAAVSTIFSLASLGLLSLKALTSMTANTYRNYVVCVVDDDDITWWHLCVWFFLTLSISEKRSVVNCGHSILHEKNTPAEALLHFKSSCSYG